ncbi:hypothetical protein OC842_005446 [Tilletia horrida]|uniref:Uncharacterized protein n=1 Tax=Tilletia horrida TaxID=155126 RepID=A0AAN6GA34_9BASI|nr:hypothetical protein OC842_005446 [Tilletia horrida]
MDSAADPLSDVEDAPASAPASAAGAAPPTRALHQPKARRTTTAATDGSTSATGAAASPRTEAAGPSRARSPLRLPAALVSPRALFAALPTSSSSSLPTAAGVGGPGGGGPGSSNDPDSLFFHSGPPAPIPRPTSPGIAHPGQHPRRRGRGSNKHASSLQTLRNNAYPGGNQRMLFFPGAVPTGTHAAGGGINAAAAGLNGNGAGRARGRQITHYGAGDVDYSPSPSPPISPGLGPAFGRSNGGGAGAGRAGYLVEHGVRRAGKQRAYDNGLADSDVLTNPLLHARAGVNGGASSADTGQRRISWTRTLFRPTRDQVERWLDSWLKRWSVLAIIPALVVWIWCAVPFPHSDPDSVGAPWGDPKMSAWTIASNSRPSAPHLPTAPPSAPAAAVDANFVFFLLFYYGIYVAVALIYVTQLFSLYRLNWWPAALGARTSYTFFWASTLVVGWAIHRWDPFGTEERHRKHRGEGDDIQWQRKTLWVMLAFVAMAMPAVVCLTGLRRSGRQAYRHSLTDMQKTFLERQLTMRIPSSYIRFLWFIASISLALLALLAGQGYASVYLSTLPHTSLEGTAYVTFWMTTVNCMALASHWILEEKVRSRALVFVFKYYYFLVYFIFYRNLFARLRSFDQFALIQLLSSFWVCIWYPFSMSGFCHRIVQYFNPEPKSWEEYVESVGLAFYLRNLAQNTTMLAFLGWVSILHFGNNQQLYPFFAFADKNDPYNYQLTMLGSLAIWASELLSSFVARELCKWAFHVDVTALGLDEMRAYPEIVPTCVWSTIHVLMDMLFFLIKLNFH